jgi:hypothetical protein
VSLIIVGLGGSGYPPGEHFHVADARIALFSERTENPNGGLTLD